MTNKEKLQKAARLVNEVLRDEADNNYNAQSVRFDYAAFNITELGRRAVFDQIEQFNVTIETKV